MKEAQTSYNTAFTKLAKMHVIWRFVNAQDVIRHRTKKRTFGVFIATFVSFMVEGLYGKKLAERLACKLIGGIFHVKKSSYSTIRRI